MINYPDDFDIVQFMKRHSLSITVSPILGKHGYRCYLMCGNSPITRSGLAISAYSKYNNGTDVLVAMSLAILETVLTINGNKVLVI